MEYADAVNLLAGVVEQARKDTRNLSLSEPHVCSIDYFHSPRRCAKEFLAALDTKLATNHHRMTTIELAEAVMEVIG
jgi:hypothetical protein